MGNRPENRPNPDDLLAAIKAHDRDGQEGRLKIFFGMCAGVGKTYAMLLEAHRLQAEGRDVVIGYIETHGRAETEALLQGLEIIPRMQKVHRGIAVTEFDLDATLRRRPQIVLVDELPHTNVQGARHPKRYQDVIELLDNGMTVYTTMNVQHLESRTDTVEEITGVPMRETIPDSLLERSHDIVLIDLAPRELLKRLQEGKVYAPEGSARAMSGFFRHGNLVALREMALRVVAEKVDWQLTDYMQRRRIQGPWKSAERLLVAVSWSPFSAQLIRWTRRMATTMEAPWIAAYVETSHPINEAQSSQLMKNLRLAQELGAELVTVRAEDVVSGLLEMARQRNITQIVVGKPNATWIKFRWNSTSLVEQLIRKSGRIDIYVVQGDKEVVAAAGAIPSMASPLKFGRQYAIALAVVLAVVGLLFAFSFYFDYLAIAMLLLFMVTLLSLWLGRGPVLFAATLSALCWNFLFIPPRFTFSIARVEDVLIFCMYFIIAIVTGTLTAKIKRKEETVRLREARAIALYNMSRELAAADSIDDIAAIAIAQLGQVFHADILLFLQRENGLVPHGNGTWQVSEKEQNVVQWVMKNRKPAGRFTDSLPMAKGRFEALVTPRGTYGVVGVHFRDTKVFTLDQESLLDNFISQIAAALERETFSELRHHAELAAASERLYQTLLNSISHEFRTPLSIISGAVSSLLDPELGLSEKSRIELKLEIREASTRLDALVENLLNMSRLESGKIRPHIAWCDITDLFSALRRRYPEDMAHHILRYDIANGMPLVKIDEGLLQQAVDNLLQNAIQHTQNGTAVHVTTRIEEKQLVITVRDHGAGIPETELPHLFEKFYRVPGTQSTGTGLGLSICKGLVESMKGTVAVANVPADGAEFTIRIPVEMHSARLESNHDESN
jgi:two-component system, OmpR family, sensor histidine kinase KdpD